MSLSNSGNIINSWVSPDFKLTSTNLFPSISLNGATLSETTNLLTPQCNSPSFPILRIYDQQVIWSLSLNDLKVLLNCSQFSFGKPKSINSLVNVVSGTSYLEAFSMINVMQAMVELISCQLKPDCSSILNILADWS